MAWWNENHVVHKVPVNENFSFAFQYSCLSFRPLWVHEQKDVFLRNLVFGNNHHLRCLIRKIISQDDCSADNRISIVNARCSCGRKLFGITLGNFGSCALPSCTVIAEFCVKKFQAKAENRKETNKSGHSFSHCWFQMDDFFSTQLHWWLSICMQTDRLTAGCQVFSEEIQRIEKQNALRWFHRAQRMCSALPHPNSPAQAHGFLWNKHR